MFVACGSSRRDAYFEMVQSSNLPGYSKADIGQVRPTLHARL